MYENINRAKLPVGTILLDTSDELKHYRHIYITKSEVLMLSDGSSIADVISIFVSDRGSLDVSNMGAIDTCRPNLMVLWSPAELDVPEGGPAPEVVAPDVEVPLG